MDRNELLRKLIRYEIGLLQAKSGVLRAGMTDTSGYDGQIHAIEYAITLAKMPDEPEKADEPDEKPVKIPEDYWLTVSIFNMCRILSDKCDKEMNAMESMTDKWDKSKYENISKLRTECRRFLTDWQIHDL